MDMKIIWFLALLAGQCSPDGDTPYDSRRTPDSLSPSDSLDLDSGEQDETGDSRVVDDTGPYDADGDGWVASEDCDDGDATTHPGASDAFCDGVDHDCDGVVGVALLDEMELDSVQDAIGSAGDEGTVLICPGTHVEKLAVTHYQQIVLESYSGSYEDTVLSGEGTGRILDIASGAEVELVGLSLVHGYAELSAGGAVHAEEAGLVLRGCHFSENESLDVGGAVFWSATAPVSSIEFSVEDCVFEDNRADEGGAIYARTETGDLSVSIAGGRFERNEVTLFDGGAVNLSSGLADVDVNIESTLFEANVGGAGGAVYVYSTRDATLRLSDSSFTNNSAKGAGAIYQSLREHGVLEVDSCDFQDNEATTNGGGALWAAAGSDGLFEVSIRGSLFSSNTSADEAGALRIYANDAVSLTISDTRFERNTSETYGAVSLGIWGELAGAFERVDVVDNINTGTSGSSVGGIYLSGYASGTLDLFEGSITGNTGDDSGGFRYGGDEVVLTSTNVDWGEGKSDNSPYDLVGFGETLDDLGTNETFTCDADGCR